MKFESKIVMPSAVVVTIDNMVYQADASHPNYKILRQAVKDDDATIFVDSFDIKQCRFFFSAVEDEAIDEILGWVRQGMLLIEARDRSDKSFNKDHDRNLQHYPTLLKKLGEHGFSIVHKEVAQGLAPNGEEDPMIIRIVASKNEDVGKS